LGSGAVKKGREGRKQERRTKSQGQEGPEKKRLKVIKRK
jgi:hypothetical protein